MLREGDHDFAISRSYYAMFYLAKAALLTKGLTHSKHSGVISAFGEHFIKKGIFPKQFGRMLSDAFAERNLVDYGTSTPSPEEAIGIVESAREFMRVLGEFLKEYIEKGYG